MARLAGSATSGWSFARPGRWTSPTRSNCRYATLNTGSTLTRGERDRATFRVETDFRRDANAILTATVSYNDCGRHSRTQFKRFGLLLPVDGGDRGRATTTAGRGNGNDHSGNGNDHNGQGNGNDHNGQGNGNDHNRNGNDHNGQGSGNDNHKDATKAKATAS